MPTSREHAQANSEDIAIFAPTSQGKSQTDISCVRVGRIRRKAYSCGWRRYLCDATHPKIKLGYLLSTRHPSNLSTVAKMDQIYSTFLSTYDWDDEDFVEDYRLAMG